MGNLTTLENTLAELHHREYVHLVGNGTTALYLILKAIGFENKNIAIPNNVCINVPMAVLFAQNIPVYLDITKENLGLDVHEISHCESQLDAVIAVHAYGWVCDIENISKTCREKRILLIEDLAAAQGAHHGGTPVGSWGDTAIVSFGAGKIIDAGQGGAILTDDRKLIEETREIEKNLPYLTSEDKIKISELNRFHTSLYNENYGNDINRFAPEFKARAINAKSAFLHRFNPDYTQIILKKLANLENNILGRQEKARRFTERFQTSLGNDGEIFPIVPGAVPWRYNLFIHKSRNELLRYLLSKKYKISSWYPSADLFFELRSKGMVHTAVSDEVGDKIMNLWVNDEVGRDYITAISREILEFFDRH